MAQTIQEMPARGELAAQGKSIPCKLQGLPVCDDLILELDEVKVRVTRVL